jgi:hypothetical protein
VGKMKFKRLMIIAVLLSCFVFFTAGHVLAAEEEEDEEEDDAGSSSNDSGATVHTGMKDISGTEVLPSDPVGATTTVHGPIKIILSFVIIALLASVVANILGGGIHINWSRLTRSLTAGYGWTSILIAIASVLVVAVAIPTVIRLYNDYMAT